VPRKDNERADALSRRDQDMPKDAKDNRLMDRHMQLLRPEVLAAHARVVAMPVETRRAHARANDDARNESTRNESTGNESAGSVRQTTIEMPQGRVDTSIIIGELPDEILD